MKDSVKSERFKNLSADRKRIEKGLLIAIIDICIVIVASYASLWVRYDFSINAIEYRFLINVTKALPYNIISVLVIFFLFKLYQSVWRYASANELIKLACACTLNSVLQLVVFTLFGISVPRSYYLFYLMLLGIGTAGVRFSYRAIRAFFQRGVSKKNNPDVKNIMIVGAGAAGNVIAREIETSKYLTMTVKCFIDDNPGCIGKYMRGIPIVGGRESILEAAEKYEIDEIIIAIPSASRLKIKELADICKETGCHLQILPGMYQLINGDVSLSKLREVSIEDLLGREPVNINLDEIADYVRGKTVLVTGGGGSIGSELVRQLAIHEPKLLIIVDIYENNAYEIEQEIKRKYPNLNLKVLIASVRDAEKIDMIFNEFRPDIVYHAAAHKHVPLMETSPAEAIKNNVYGTLNTARAADKYGSQKFVLVSTDKAVNPTNIMGASKRMCEMVIQMMNERSRTNFVAVRFGNVLGSNGSVIPLFKSQIAAGGPVTVTDPEIIRYFMTIPEAVSLILQAGAYAWGGEIFVLDMGEPVKILDLAKNLIKLSGYRVGEDIEIVFTGLRPGEKMYEELLMGEEGLKSTKNNLIHIGKPIEFDRERFISDLEALKPICEHAPERVKEEVSKIVTTYHYGVQR